MRKIEWALFIITILIIAALQVQAESTALTREIIQYRQQYKLLDSAIAQSPYSGSNYSNAVDEYNVS